MRNEGLGNEKSTGRSISGDGGARSLCRLWHHLTAFGILQWLSSEMSHHTSHAILKLTILGGVDKGIDTAVDVHQHIANIGVPVVTRYAVANQAENIHDLVDRPACNESAAYDQWCHRCITAWFVRGSIVHWYHLKINNENGNVQQFHFISLIM